MVCSTTVASLLQSSSPKTVNSRRPIAHSFHLHRQPCKHKSFTHRYIMQMRNHGIASDGLPSSRLKDGYTVSDSAARLPGLATDDNPYRYQVRHENLRGASGCDLFCSRQTGGFLRFLSHVESSVSFSAIQPGCRFLLSSTTILRRG